MSLPLPAAGAAREPASPRFQAGLVSITYRQLNPSALITLAGEAGLAGIEWGGDVHVPPGNQKLARTIRERTEAAGLAIVTYGSYYRLGTGTTPPFSAWLETALSLGAQRLRVWAGRQPSAQATATDWTAILAEARAIVAAATAAGVTILFEHHANTLTDTTATATRLLAGVPGSRLGWQPPNGVSADAAAADLAALLPWVATAHVFAWGRDGSERLPLAGHGARWRRYLRQLATRPEATWLLLEHLPADDPALLAREADTLRHLIATAGPPERSP